MKRALVVAVAAAALFTLTGCGESEEQYDPIERGKACFEAGGEWDWSEWSGYHCEFGGDD